MVWLLLLLGCPQPDGCRPSDNPTMTIGLGANAYEPIPDDGHAPLVYGPQGGYHVDLALDVTGLASEELATGTFVGTWDDGTVVSEQNPWLGLRCNNETGSLQAFAVRLIFDWETPDGEPLTPERLHDTTVNIDGTLVDVDGREVSAEASIVVWDETQE